MAESEVGGRYLCDITNDMRTCLKTLNFALFPSLIEELQYRANRIEDRLNRFRDIKHFEARRNKLKLEVENLENDKLVLENEIEQLQREKTKNEE